MNQGYCRRDLIITAPSLYSLDILDTASTILFVSFTFLVAGIVKGVIGMGLPTVAMGLLGLTMAPVQAAALLVIPSLVTNIWQLAIGPSVTALLKRFATMMLGICIGTAAGIGLLTNSSGILATVILGVLLAIYGIFGLVSPSFAVSRRFEYWLSPLVGIITGLLAGATGVFVIPAVPYLNSVGLDKEHLIQALGLSFTVSTLALAIGLMVNGRFELTVAGSSLLALFPALVGMYLGQIIRGKLQPQLFRRWFFIGMLVLGVYIALRAWMTA